MTLIHYLYKISISNVTDWEKEAELKNSIKSNLENKLVDEISNKIHINNLLEEIEQSCLNKTIFICCCPESESTILIQKCKELFESISTDKQTYFIDYNMSTFSLFSKKINDYILFYKLKCKFIN